MSSIARVTPAGKSAVLLPRKTVRVRGTAISALDFARMRCHPCEEAPGSLEVMGLSLALDKTTASQYLRQVDGWEMVQDEHCHSKIRKVFRVKNYMKGLELCQRIGMVAEVEGHHPDLHLEAWNLLTVELWTHARGGLTESDFIMAAKIDRLPKDELLSKRKYRRP